MIDFTQCAQFSPQINSVTCKSTELEFDYDCIRIRKCSKICQMSMLKLMNVITTNVNMVDIKTPEQQELLESIPANVDTPQRWLNCEKDNPALARKRWVSKIQNSGKAVSKCNL